MANGEPRHQVVLGATQWKANKGLAPETVARGIDTCVQFRPNHGGGAASELRRGVRLLLAVGRDDPLTCRAVDGRSWAAVATAQVDSHRGLRHGRQLAICFGLVGHGKCAVSLVWPTSILLPVSI